MMNHVYGPLDAHDPDVERAMKTVAQLAPGQRDEFIRSVYRYAYAYRRTRHPNLLIELINSVIGSVALRESPEHAQALEQWRAAREATKGQPPVDVQQLVAEERQRRAG
jgi:hypothetical protein